MKQNSGTASYHSVRNLYFPFAIQNQGL